MYSIVDKETGEVTNTIVIGEKGIPKSLESRKDILVIESGAIGWTWDGKKFVDNRPKPEPISEPQEPTLQDKYEALLAVLEEKELVTGEELKQAREAIKIELPYIENKRK